MYLHAVSNRALGGEGRIILTPPVLDDVENDIEVSSVKGSLLIEDDLGNHRPSRLHKSRRPLFFIFPEVASFWFLGGCRSSKFLLHVSC